MPKTHTVKQLTRVCAQRTSLISWTRPAFVPPQWIPQKMGTNWEGPLDIACFPCLCLVI